MIDDKERIYDAVIIGGGPAGLAAGIYAGRANLKTVILEKGLFGGAVLLTWKVDNYPGFRGESAADLAAAMEKQARDAGCEMSREEVVGLRTDREIKEVVTSSGSRLARGVIIATGARPNPLGVPGEKEFVGKGVSYCATCDGAFFQGMPVAVIGGGDTAVEEAAFLTRFASHVYLVHRRDKLRAVQSEQGELMSKENVTIVWDSVLEEIKGDSGVSSVLLKNVKTSKNSTLDVKGVFIFVGISPNVEFMKGRLDADEWGFIKTDEDCRTSIPGIYAAGDVRSKKMRQIVNAVGEGATAAYILDKSLKSY